MLPVLSLSKSNRVINLTNKKDAYSVGPFMEIFEDQTGKVSFNEIINGKWNHQFKGNHGKTPNFGYSKSSFWIRVKVRNEETKKKWFFSFNNYYQNKIKFFNKNEKGNWSEEITGDLIPFVKRKYKYRPFVFKLNRSSYSTYYFHLKSKEGAGEIEIEILSKEKLQKKEESSNLFLWNLFWINSFDVGFIIY